MVRVLIVEDEALIRVELEDIVQDAGFGPLAVASGEAAVEILDTEPGIKAVVTDINLGEGIDGWEIARHARTRHPDIAVVYVTSISRDEWSAEGVPGSILVNKPFAPAQIVTALSQLLNKNSVH